MDTNLCVNAAAACTIEGAYRIYYTFLLHCSSLRHCREKERPLEMLHTCTRSCPISVHINGEHLKM